MAGYAILNEIKTLDPLKDHLRIVFLNTCFEFPWDTTRALEFALYRTYCVPSVSALLDKTGEFAARPQKRYDDTDIIISELMEWGYDSDRGKRALRRLNQMHGRFSIANEDFQYRMAIFNSVAMFEFGMLDSLTIDVRTVSTLQVHYSTTRWIDLNEEMFS